MAGEDWRRAFMARNKEISIRKPEACSLSRLTSFNAHNVQLFFNNLRRILEKHPSLTDGSRIFNLDETGTQTVQVPKRILAPKGVKQVYQSTSGERGETVTMCGIISAAGTFLPPALVFPRKNFKNHMMKDSPTGALGLANPSGWMKSDIFLDVLNHFIAHSHSSTENPSLLIYDNHESHISVAVVQRAREAGVHILTIPPHCSNRLQPLDISVYGPFKAYYNAACDKWMLQHPGIPMTIYDSAGRISEALEKSFTPSNIIAGFRKSGIHPFNPEIFTEADFLTSFVTDRPNPSEPQIHEETENEGSQPGSSHTADFSLQEEGKKEENDQAQIQTARSLNEKTPPKSTQMADANFISPIDIRGFPKALPRKQVRKRRERGRSTVITETPEKDKLIEKEKSKESIQKVKRHMGELQKNGGKESTCKNKKIRNRRDSTDDTSEDSSDYEVLSETEDWVPDDEVENSIVTKEDISEGKFVLIKFPRKIFYVAKIIGVSDDEFEVSFLRKSLKFSNCFLFPNVADISFITLNDIAMILPEPVPGTTKRQSTMYKFGINFSSVNVR